MKTKAIRILEKELYRWPDVKRDTSAGKISYLVGNRHFASVASDFLVLSRLNPEDRAELEEQWQAGPYYIGDRKVGFETQIPFDEDNVIALLPYVKKSYEHALTWKGV